MILEANSNCLIEIDGGVGLNNAKSLVEAGADVLVAGSAVFASENPLKTVEQLKNID
jgi:ribulose-phosphate 3-epimerase